ncbi:MAG TPA: PAS domain-containing protein [bacterium]|nr:PAS domain-containing protein [bacterium]
MNLALRSLEDLFASLPLPLLAVWGQLAFIIGFALALAAFGGFTFRPGGHWGLGREHQAWDTKALLSIPLTFLLIVLTGYIGSFIVLVPGAQTFESLKDLTVFLCVVLFGYPALLTVPFAYGLSDLIEGVPPSFLMDWLPGYFINPTCFWVAYQLFGKDPDFRKARTWGLYLLFLASFMVFEPVLWGHICAGKFTPEISYRNITSALAFTTSITWLIAPFAMLAAFPLVRKLGMFWADIPGHVRERRLGSREWAWTSGGAPIGQGPQGLPIRLVVLAPFLSLILVMVGATAYVTLKSAREDAYKLAGRLHEEISKGIDLSLDDYLDHVPKGDDPEQGIGELLRKLPVAKHGIALVVGRDGRIVASSSPDPDGVQTHALESLDAAHQDLGALQDGVLFHFDHVTEKPLDRVTWLGRAIAYQDRRGGHRDWLLVTLMPESYYLAGVAEGNSRSAMISAVALLSGLGLAIFLGTLMTSGLRRLSLATQALARGDLSQRMSGSRLEELNDLSDSFNLMADRLSESIGQLRAEVRTRKEREEELELGRNRLEVALKAGDLAIWDWDIVEDKLTWDEAMFRLYDLPAEGFKANFQAWARLVDPDDFIRADSDLRAAIRGERPFNTEFRVRLKSGARRTIRGMGQVLRDGNGVPLRIVGINWDATQRLASEEALRQSETFLRLAQEAAHVGSWEWDLGSGTFKWSEELARIHGIKLSEFDGRVETLMAFCHPQDRDRLRAAMARVAREGDDAGFECRIVRKDGIERDLWFLGRPLKGPEGDTLKVLGIALDTTERKYQDILMAEETRLLEMIASGSSMPEVLDAMVRGIEAISKDMTGSILLLTPDGTRFERIAAPSLPEVYCQAILKEPIGPQAGSCGTAVHLGKPVITQDIQTDPLWEKYRDWVEPFGLRACWSTPIRDAQGKVLGTFAMYYKEPRLPGPEDQMLIQRATHLAGVAIEKCRVRAENTQLMHDLGERVKELTCLKSAAEVLRDEELTNADWIREVCRLLPPAWQYPEVTEARIRLGDVEYATPGFRRSSWVQESRFTTSRGKEGTIEVAYLEPRPPESEGPFLREERNLIDSIAGMLRISIDRRESEGDRRRLEQQFQQAQKMEAVGHLAGGIAHDFNNMLSAIMGYADLLKGEMDPQDPRRHDLEQILTISEKAAGLTRQLLTFSRKQVIQPVVLDLNQSVENVLKMLKRVIGEDIHVSTDLSPAPVHCKADPGQMEQAILNLAVNARDAMPKGGGLYLSTSRVRLDEDHCRLYPGAVPGDHVLLTVRDTGTGMTPEVQARIFEPFFTTKEAGKGTGLGMAMVYGIVQQSGGHIAIDSIPGRGTSFLLYFPAAASSAGPVREKAPAPEPGHARNELILLVEDEESLRRLASRALTDNGYRVLSASSGHDALRVLDEHGPSIQLLVSDVVMPSLSGPALAEMVRERFPHMPVLFISGHADHAVFEHGLQKDKFDFLPKPYKVQELLVKVREVLDTREKQQGVPSSTA